MADIVINGVQYNAVPEIDVPKQTSGTAKFFDTEDADAGQSNVLSGKIFYGASGKGIGSMANNGDVSDDIETKSGTVTIPEGYTSGGSVGIDSGEQAKIIAKNIKSGITLLGQAGDSNVVDTELSSGAATTSQILSGYSAFVNGSKVDGTATFPTISQDSSTKVLSIA